ncbi:MAG TPA: asparagine synthase-related protein, partial [Steroidobacteraceae bacterium]
CYNYHSKGSNTDERYYARLAAQRSQSQLIEWPRDPSLRLESILRMRKHPVPENYISVVEAAEVEPQLVERCGATAITTGVGGDQLWCQNLAMGAIDYAVCHGIRPGLFQVAMESARLESASVWRTLVEALNHAMLRRANNIESIFDQFNRRVLITDAATAALRRGGGYTHPLIAEYSRPEAAGGRLGLGKLLQLMQLLRPGFTQNLLTPYGMPLYLSPLLSQPLIELALSIPTYIHTHGGWDRAIARLAFQHDLPAEVVNRRSKGGSEEQSRAVFKGNVDFISRWIANGELVRQSVLDRQGLSDLFSGRPTRRDATPVEIYDCLFTETWLRHYVQSPVGARSTGQVAMQQSLPTRM